jgi:hypothetical protein
VGGEIVIPMSEALRAADNKFSLKILSQNAVEILSVSNLNYRSASLKFLSPLNCPMTRAGGGSGKLASHL